MQGLFLHQGYKKFLKIILIAVILIGLFLTYSFFNPSEHSFFISCPIKYATGFYCPGCGSQRAIHQLLHFNIINAFRLNPLMVLSLPIIFYGLWLQMWNFIFETKYRVRLFYSKLFIYGYFGTVLLYWILRNIPFSPFNLLAPTE